MREVIVKLFTFSELSEAAKQNAISNYRNKGYDPAWTDENKDSLEKFAELFNIKVTNWSYGGRGEGVDWTDNWDYSEIGELSGIRLSKYIWNNYRNELFKCKYYNVKSKNQIKHKRVISKFYKNSDNWGNYYYSAFKTDTSCVLTGYCMDDEILAPIYRELNKPTGCTFTELIDECFSEWVKACNNDIDFQNSDEYISEHLEANNYEFTEDGEED